MYTQWNHHGVTSSPQQPLSPSGRQRERLLTDARANESTTHAHAMAVGASVFSLIGVNSTPTKLRKENKSQDWYDQPMVNPSSATTRRHLWCQRMTFQLHTINRTLGSVSPMVDQGHRAVFSPTDSSNVKSLPHGETKTSQECTCCCSW